MIWFIWFCPVAAKWCFFKWQKNVFGKITVEVISIESPFFCFLKWLAAVNFSIWIKYLFFFGVWFTSCTTNPVLNFINYRSRIPFGSDLHFFIHIQALCESIKRMLANNPEKRVKWALSPSLESFFYPKSTLNVIYACIYQIPWRNGLIGYGQISKVVLAVVMMLLMGMIVVVMVIGVVAIKKRNHISCRK